MRLELRKALTQLRELADEIGHVVLAAERGPVDPAGLIILAIGVVVAALAVGAFVAGEQKRHALRQQQAGELIAAQPAPQREDVGIVRRSLGAAVGAQVVVGAVACGLGIGFVVIVLVAEE